MFKFYEVGGKVRDELMGLKSKDVDYSVVPCETLTGGPIEDIFTLLVQYLKDENFTIFLTTPECYTIRAMFPPGHTYSGVADFVLARKEIGYKPYTRTPVVVPGSLYDDLQRRDFTVNSIAKREDGTYYDPFDGQGDIKRRILRTPINGLITFQDDPLRLLRALRFAVTKDFTLSEEINEILLDFPYNEKFNVVSEDRIREEMNKMLKHDTLQTIAYVMPKYFRLFGYIFKNTKLWLKPTNEQ